MKEKRAFANFIYGPILTVRIQLDAIRQGFIFGHMKTILRWFWILTLMAAVLPRASAQEIGRAHV